MVFICMNRQGASYFNSRKPCMRLVEENIIECVVSFVSVFSCVPMFCYIYSPKRLVDSSAAMYYNNLACIHMMMRKHHLGSFYFKKAITENENLAKELKLETLGKCVISFPCPLLITICYQNGHLMTLYRS